MIGSGTFRVLKEGDKTIELPFDERKEKHIKRTYLHNAQSSHILCRGLRSEKEESTGLRCRLDWSRTRRTSCRKHLWGREVDG